MKALSLVAFLGLVVSADTVFAANVVNPLKPKSVVPDSTKTVEGIFCGSIKGAFEPGRSVAGGKFITLSEDIRVLKLKIKTQSGAAKTKSQKKLKTLKASLISGRLSCAKPSPTPTATATPQATPTPTPAAVECESMDTYAGTFGDNEMYYLLEKFGLGVGVKEEERLLPIGRSQGIAAFVTAATTAADEDQGVLEAVDAMAAQDPANTSNNAILYHDILTKNPVHLRVTESLHGVLTTGHDVLPNNLKRLWYDHWKILRTAALQNKTYNQLLKDSAKSPMMLYYLDGRTNTGQNPNENYGRELQELFSLGVECPGTTTRNYTETRPLGDVLNAGRILTGYQVDTNTGVMSFVPQLHDNNPYEMYSGSAYAFTANTADGLIDNVLLKHPCAGDFYAQELIKDFLTEEPPAGLVKNFGATIRANGFRIMDSVAVLMKSKAAFCTAYKDSVTKKPDRLVAELVRIMKLRDAVNSNQQNIMDLASRVESAGFTIDFPENVFYFKPQVFRTSSAQIELLNSVGTLVTIARNAGLALFNPQSILPTDTTATAREVVQHVARRLNVTLTSDQESIYMYYLNNTFDNNGNPTFSPYVNTAQKQMEKGLTLYLIMSILPQVSLA